MYTTKGHPKAVMDYIVLPSLRFGVTSMSHSQGWGCERRSGSQYCSALSVASKTRPQGIPAIVTIIPTFLCTTLVISLVSLAGVVSKTLCILLRANNVITG